ncbi:MAG: biotin synthase BioB [Clostridia bacterium]|nr:biotin synthase BioB [Clostridia bacterium]
MYEQLVEEIINGRRLTRKDDVSFLIYGDLDSLKEGANRIRKELCGNRVDLCTIINGRSGGCSENCKFCAQSAHNHTGATVYSFLDEDEIVAECKKNERNGAHKFSIVTAGRSLSEKDFDAAAKAYHRMHEECHEISLCASHGFLTEEQFRILRANGVTMYHENIETSRRFFPFICTTHTYDEKIECIKAAQRAGMEVCSGGILGMGETWEDRLDMAFDLAELHIDSIPLNALMPIPGTPLEGRDTLSEEDILRSVALFRFINPIADVRLAAGRNLMKECGKEAFFSGANATITGDMLTTSGNNTAMDLQMLTENGFDVSRPMLAEEMV